MASSCRIVVAEDNLLVREGLSALISSQDDFELAGVASDMAELDEAVDRHDPHVVVTDIRMPPDHSDEGIRCARRFRTSRPQLGVVVLSQFVEPDYAVALFDGGTAGRAYLLKERIDRAGRLADAIRTVAGGGSFIDDDVVDALVRARTRLVDSPIRTLTGRERDVLSEMATGATNALIGERLHVSEHSVEKHSSAIFTKLGLAERDEVNRRVAAVVMFLAGHDEAIPHP